MFALCAIPDCGSSDCHWNTAWQAPCARCREPHSANCIRVQGAMAQGPLEEYLNMGELGDCPGCESA